MRFRIGVIVLLVVIAFGSIVAVAGEVGIRVGWLPGILSPGAVREYRVSLHHAGGDTMLVTLTPILDEGQTSFAVTSGTVDPLADYDAFIWSHTIYPSGSEDWSYTTCASPAEYSGAPNGCACVRVGIE